MIATVPKLMGIEIGRKFEEKEKQLKMKTQTPEEVAAQREYIASLPAKILEHRQEIDATEVLGSHSNPLYTCSKKCGRTIFHLKLGMSADLLYRIG